MSLEMVTTTNFGKTFFDDGHPPLVLIFEVMVSTWLKVTDDTMLFLYHTRTWNNFGEHCLQHSKKNIGVLFTTFKRIDESAPPYNLCICCKKNFNRS